MPPSATAGPAPTTSQTAQAKQYAQEVTAGLARVFASLKSVTDGVAKVTDGLKRMAEAAKGFDALKGAGLSAGLAKAGETAGRLRDGLAQTAAAGQAAFGMLQRGVVGWVRAGLEGTAQAAMFGHHIQMMSRAIAAIFLPVIDQLVSAVQAVSQWFQNLTEGQQNLIARVTVAVGVFAAAAVVLPQVATAVGVVVAAVKGLSAVFAGVTGIASGGILPILGLLAAALVAVVGASGDGAGALGGVGKTLGKLWEAVKPVVDAVGDALAGAFEEMRPALEQVGNALAQVGALVAEHVVGLLKAMAPLGEMILSVVVTAVDVLGTVLGALVPILAEVASVWRGVLSAALEAAAPLFREIQTYAVAWGETLKVTFETLKPIIAELGKTFTRLAEDMKPVVTWVAEKLVNALKAALESVTKTIVAVKLLQQQGLGALLDPAEFVRGVELEYERLRKLAEKRGGAGGGKKKDDEPGRRIAPTPGSFEDVGNLFKRIQTAAIGGKKDPAEEQAKDVKDIKKGLDKMLEDMLKPDRPEPAPLR